MNKRSTENIMLLFGVGITLTILYLSINKLGLEYKQNKN